MKQKILVVDDEIEIRRFVVDELAQKGYETVSARNAKEFKEMAFSSNPDLIILDLMLGTDMSMDTYNQILRQGFDPKTPILFVTGIADEHPASPAAPGRLFALLKKPFKIHELFEEVQTLIEKKNHPPQN